MACRWSSILLSIALLGCVHLAGCRDSRAHKKALRIYAASSLTEAFQALKRGFQAKHPGVHVSLTFAGSQVLRLQLTQGARADAFASANLQHMEALRKAGLIHTSRVFAHNELVLIVPPGTSSIRTFADLPKAKRLVVGTPYVPIGAYSRAMLKRAASHYGEAFVRKVKSRIVSEESNVRLVRAKVALGEADAALVYRTDAISFKQVTSLSIPKKVNIRAAYSQGLLTQRPTARRWQAYLSSKQAQEVLKAHGFLVKRR